MFPQTDKKKEREISHLANSFEIYSAPTAAINYLFNSIIISYEFLNVSFYQQFD